MQFHINVICLATWFIMQLHLQFVSKQVQMPDTLRAAWAIPGGILCIAISSQAVSSSLISVLFEGITDHKRLAQYNISNHLLKKSTGHVNSNGYIFAGRGSLFGATPVTRHFYISVPFWLYFQNLITNCGHLDFLLYPPGEYQSGTPECMLKKVVTCLLSHVAL